MLASDLVSLLRLIIDDEGDFHVVDEYDRPVDTPEINTDHEPTVIILSFEGA